MKSFKKVLAIILCVALVGVLFAGCASSETADEITDKTMIVAYTEENAPFIYTDENGNLTGFDVEVVANIFESVKGDYDNYKFVQVEEGYVLGEDVAYTDSEGNDYVADIFCGGMQKDVGTVNEDYYWTDDIISNKVVTVVKDSAITSYNDLSGVTAGVVSDLAAQALDENTAVKNRLAGVNTYANLDEAFAALEAGEIGAVIANDFDLYKNSASSSYTVLDGALKTVNYGFAFDKATGYADSFNEAITEMLSPDYGDGDTLTPLVEKFFSNSAACVFTVETETEQ